MKSVIDIAHLPHELKQEIIDGLHRGDITARQAHRIIDRYRKDRSDARTNQHKPVGDAQGFESNGGYHA